MLFSPWINIISAHIILSSAKIASNAKNNYKADICERRELPAAAQSKPAGIVDCLQSETSDDLCFLNSKLCAYTQTFKTMFV